MMKGNPVIANMPAAVDVDKWLIALRVCEISSSTTTRSSTSPSSSTNESL